MAITSKEKYIMDKTGETRKIFWKKDLVRKRKVYREIRDYVRDVYKTKDVICGVTVVDMLNICDVTAIAVLNICDFRGIDVLNIVL